MEEAASHAHDQPTSDVAIIGSGIAGTVLASILSRAGLDVLLLDAGTHPRFAVGESTIPHTSMLMHMVAKRYDVPEIEELASFEGVQGRVSPASGIKRNFGFLYHREGRSQEPAEANELPLPGIINTENHFFRQDVDAWMLSVAVRYGATVHQRVNVTDVDIDDNGATLTSSTGETWRTRFVVDASGFRSPLADKMDLREQPSRLRHNARTLFTHMINVKPYESLVPHGTHANVMPWSQGTLHHLFEGGWIWVIPFNNHAKARNPLVSVGLSLDPRLYPKPENMTPEEEFRQFIAKFPDIAPQFEGARSVREWVSTGRFQYSSKQTVGYRWCLTAHASGFIDALFSRGLANTFEIINALGWRLIEAVRDDDFAVERFKLVEELEQGLLDFNDDLVANAYTSWKHYDLWDAWFRVWSVNQRLSNFEINRAYGRYLKTGDRHILEDYERHAVHGTLAEYQPARQLFANASEQLRQVHEGMVAPRVAAESIMKSLRTADFLPPALGAGEPLNRCIHVTPGKVVSMLKWAKNDAPPEVGRLVHEGLTYFLGRRFAPGKFNPVSEVFKARRRVKAK
ncbi:NAD(P)/FAD-dependent oxidoreductase [Streptomyces sp. NPDC059037]|uniref:NAD(P)/FAD-dependent oxidoreductase n=1 Tax=Streptomyces sp. NPDC059037 TaxID=3346710 RepID=UPI00369B5F42